MPESQRYIPQRQDIILIDFDPSAGKEIQKRRPAVVVSCQKYARATGFVAVCPITHGAHMQKRWGVVVEVHHPKIDGSVVPFQLHTYDFRARRASKVGFMETGDFEQVVQLNRYIFEE